MNGSRQPNGLALWYEAKDAEFVIFVGCMTLKNNSTFMIDNEEIKQVYEAADCLYNQQQVEQAIDRLAGKISDCLKGRNPLLLCLMNGGLVFTGQILTRLPFPLELDYIHASRYRGKTEGHTLNWIRYPETSLKGRVVLILDDILDEGITLAEVINFCREQGAKVVYSAVLIEKTLRQEKPCKADFVGLQAEDRYLFGYGLDYKHYLRNAAGIYACKEEK